MVNGLGWNPERAGATSPAEREAIEMNTEEYSGWITEIYKHYGLDKDAEAVETGDAEKVDFLIGKESDITELTGNMAGFGIEQSQTVTIEYDKGYGYFVAKRRKRGAPNGTPKKL